MKNEAPTDTGVLIGQDKDSPKLFFVDEGVHIFTMTQESEGAYRLVFDKAKTSLVFENETENSLEIVVKKK